MRILLVDDSEAVRGSLRQLLVEALPDPGTWLGSTCRGPIGGACRRYGRFAPCVPSCRWW